MNAENDTQKPRLSGCLSLAFIARNNYLHHRCAAIVCEVCGRDDNGADPAGPTPGPFRAQLERDYNRVLIGFIFMSLPGRDLPGRRFRFWPLVTGYGVENIAQIGKGIDHIYAEQVAGRNANIRVPEDILGVGIGIHKIIRIVTMAQAECMAEFMSRHDDTKGFSYCSECVELGGISPFPSYLNVSTRIKKSRKVYFFDNALVWALSGFKDRSIIEASGEIGHYFENLVIADFIKWGANLEKPPSFYFWQKSPASEIDLVVSTRGMVIPVEIKYSASWDKKYLHAIDMFKEKHEKKGLNVPFSLIIRQAEDFMAPREDVFCLPAWVLC